MRIQRRDGQIVVVRLAEIDYVQPRDGGQFGARGCGVRPSPRPSPGIQLPRCISVKM